MLKQRAALGFRVHSGWAVAVALAGSSHAPQMIRRCRLELTSAGARTVQPYHAARTMPVEEATHFLEGCRDATLAAAQRFVQGLAADLHEYTLKGAAVLLSSSRPLPGLAAILASHALVHAAEGEFYRATLRRACETGAIRVTGINERDLEGQAAKVLGWRLEELRSRISPERKVAGSPWRLDEKLCMLAAWLVLAQG